MPPRGLRPPCEGFAHPGEPSAPGVAVGGATEGPGLGQGAFADTASVWRCCFSRRQSPRAGAAGNRAMKSEKEARRVQDGLPEEELKRLEA